MPAKFRISKKIVPGSSGMTEMYCGTLLKNSDVTLEDIAETLSQASTLHPADCYAVMVGFADEIAEHLHQGNVVNIPQLGTFRIRAKSETAPTPEEISAKSFGKPSVNFRPSVSMKRKLLNVKFEKVKTKK